MELKNKFLQQYLIDDYIKFNETFESFGIENLFGGITYENMSLNNKLIKAKAILLPYALKHGTKIDDELAEKWELKLTEFLRKFHSPFIQFVWWTYETLAEESAKDCSKLIE